MRHVTVRYSLPHMYYSARANKPTVGRVHRSILCRIPRLALEVVVLEYGCRFAEEYAEDISYCGGHPTTQRIPSACTIPI